MAQNQYPKYLYHATEKSVKVPNQEAHAELGPGWFESPGEAAAGVALITPLAPPATTTTTAPAATVTTVNQPPASTEPSGSVPVAGDGDDAAAAEVERIKAEKESIWSTAVPKIVEKLKGASKATLERVAAYEAERPAGARSGLIKALDAAVKAVDAAESASAQ